VRRNICIFLATFFAVSIYLHSAAEDKKNLAWQTGTLIDQSVSLEDAGCAGNVCGGTYHRTHYKIAAGNKIYIANRTGSRLDIAVNMPIKFAINGNTVYLMDEKGKTHDCHLEQERDVAVAPTHVQQDQSLTSADGEATVALISSPDGADINLDDSFVGNVPATLKLKPGRHTIKLTKTGYKDWSREITALAGSHVTLSATLEKQ
jgi:hypothetical protein